MIKKIPNILSILRIILIPLVAWLILFDYFLYALITTLVISISDFLDGYIARAFNAQSEIGSYLDSIADKAFIISAYMLIGTQNLLPLFEALFWVTNPILIKRALNISGFNVGGLRLPMIDSKEYDEKFSKLLNNYEIDVTSIK